MSYAGYDATPHSGYPVELFLFAAEGVEYRYCDHDEDVTVAGLVWSSQPISKSTISKGMEVSRSEITVTLGEGVPILELFRYNIPETPVLLNVYRVHITDPDLETRLLWDGQVTSISRDSTRSTSLKCEQPEVFLSSMGLRRMYQKPCPYNLYGSGCGVNSSAFESSISIVSVSENKLTVATSMLDTSRLVGGKLVYTQGVARKVRYIASASGDSITVSRVMDWAAPGLTILVYDGCDRSASTCGSKFDNLVSFGGFPHIPSTNLFNTQAF